jgi:predicted nucleic acid-binding protein
VITAVDTNVLLELLGSDAEARQATRNEVDALNLVDDLIIGDVVYAELAGRFAGTRELDEFLRDAALSLITTQREVGFQAGIAWGAYARMRRLALSCAVCGRETIARCSSCDSVLTTRQRVLPDFFVGAHAMVNAHRLFTRDRHYFRTYFPDLHLV